MHRTIRGRKMNYRIQAITEQYRSKHGSRCERVTHEKVTEATVLAVCGGFQIESCDDEVCRDKAVHMATSFARAKMDTDQWDKNPRKAERDLRAVTKRIIES